MFSKCSELFGYKQKSRNEKLGEDFFWGNFMNVFDRM